MLKNMWQTILALWDWVGRIHLLWGLIGAAVTALIAEMLKAPAWAIFALTLAGACIFIGGALFWQQHKTSRRAFDQIDQFEQMAERFYPRESSNTEDLAAFSGMPKIDSDLSPASAVIDSPPLQLGFGLRDEISRGMGLRKETVREHAEGLRRAQREREHSQGQRKFEVLFVPNNPRYVRPFEPISLEQLAFKSRQICIEIKNVSSTTIDDVEVYCEDAGVLSTGLAHELHVSSPGTLFRTLHPGEALSVGLVKQNTEEDLEGHITRNILEVTIPIKCGKAKFRGDSFFMKVLIVGRDVDRPARKTYHFGSKHGRFVFEEAHPNPQEPAYMTAYEVIHYLADESQWGHLQKMSISDGWMKKQPLLEAFGEFQRMAADGKLTIYGRLNESGNHVLIGHTYWMSAGLETHSVLSKQISRTAPTVSSGQGVPSYSDLKILAENVYAAWPR